jgi:hypothetical protein
LGLSELPLARHNAHTLLRCCCDPVVATFQPPCCYLYLRFLAHVSVALGTVPHYLLPVVTPPSQGQVGSTRAAERSPAGNRAIRHHQLAFSAVQRCSGGWPTSSEDDDVRATWSRSLAGSCRGQGQRPCVGSLQHHRQGRGRTFQSFAVSRQPAAMNGSTAWQACPASLPAALPAKQSTWQAT